MKQATYRAIRTNLYDVIDALHTQMSIEDDQIITALVSRLIQDSHLSFCRSWPTNHDWDGCDDDKCRHDAPATTISQLVGPEQPPIDQWRQIA